MDEDLKTLEQRVDDLILMCKHLKEENSTLKSSRESQFEVNNKLYEKNRLAQTRLEAIVSRLRAMEAG